MEYFLIEFKHDSNFLGYDGIGQLLIRANSFKEACDRVDEFRKPMENTAIGFKWDEWFRNARDFVNLTM